MHFAKGPSRNMSLLLWMETVDLPGRMELKRWRVTTWVSRRWQE